MPRSKPFVCTWWAIARALLLGALALAQVNCRGRSESEASSGLSARREQDLLIGYGLLADTLSDESRLGTLDLFKTVTFDAPNDAIAKMMKTLSEASTRRASELSELRKLAPNVSRTAEGSPIGDAISETAKDLGKSEMLSRTGGFDVRFILVQAQATRMVTAMARAIARFDPNPERKAWLRRLAIEYDGYRGDLIEYLGGQQAPK